MDQQRDLEEHSVADEWRELDQQPDVEAAPVGDATQPGRLALIVAALLAGAVGLGLIAFGWWFQDWQYSTEWRRLQDGEWWAGTIVRTLGHLMLHGLGFKLALALVIGALGLLGWVRKRRYGIV